ncbi:MAG: hypothetical protein JXJ20_01130 [Anaerolineae bacterium]|jgi:hypothetical protein|nr:hypothetical protein [Anaerolineae bacterium]
MTPPASNMPGVDQLVGDDKDRSSKFVIPLWLALVAMVVALIIGALILVRVVGPLQGLLFPFEPPVPDGAEEIEHVKPDKGAEYWVYRTTMRGQDVARFYEQEDGTCWYTSSNSDVNPRPDGVSYSVARCVGQRESAGLGISWEVFIAEGYSDREGPTIFRVYKYDTLD